MQFFCRQATGFEPLRVICLERKWSIYVQHSMWTAHAQQRRSHIARGTWTTRGHRLSSSTVWPGSSLGLGSRVAVHCAPGLSMRSSRAYGHCSSYSRGMPSPGSHGTSSMAWNSAALDARSRSSSSAHRDHVFVSHDDMCFCMWCTCDAVWPGKLVHGEHAVLLSVVSYLWHIQESETQHPKQTQALLHTALHIMFVSNYCLCRMHPHSKMARHPCCHTSSARCFLLSPVPPPLQSNGALATHPFSPPSHTPIT